MFITIKDRHHGDLKTINTEHIIYVERMKDGSATIQIAHAPNGRYLHAHDYDHVMSQL